MHSYFYFSYNGSRVFFPFFTTFPLASSSGGKHSALLSNNQGILTNSISKMHPFIRISGNRQAAILLSELTMALQWLRFQLVSCDSKLRVVVSGSYLETTHHLWKTCFSACAM